MADPPVSARQTKVDWSYVTKQKESGDKSVTSDPDRVAFYDDNVEVYNDDMVACDYGGATHAAKNMHKYLNGRVDARIIDIGGGTGLVITALRKLAAYNNVDGLDPASKMLELGKEQGLYNKIFPQYFVLGSGIEHNRYDVACCSACYVPGHIRSETIKELYEILKPGGYVVIVMRKNFLDLDPDLSLLRPLIQQMSDEGKFEIKEDYQFDNYFAGYAGQVFVLRKRVEQ